MRGELSFFKSLAISKIICLALVTEIPASIINLLNQIQTECIWKWKSPKSKHSTFCNEYENAGLKSAAVFFWKVISLQCSWIKRFFDNNFHQWKVILLYLLRRCLEKDFKFYSILEISRSVLRNFPKYYQELF